MKELLRAWVFAIAVSAVTFVLLVFFNVAALDEPLSEAWLFPAVFVVGMLLIKGYFIRRKSG